MPVPGTLSVQLYSVREALEQDRPAALARLAEIGLRWVEPFGLGGGLDHAERLKRDLDAAGLQVSSTHATFPRDTGRLTEELAVIGTRQVFLPVPSAAPGTAREAFSEAGSVDRLADYLTGVAEEVGPGITVGYHNHWWEWDDLGGEPAFDRFTRRAGEAVVVELDAYWCLQAGQDPVAVVRELGARVTALHVKSGPARTGPLTLEGARVLDQVPLDRGTLPFEELLRASSASWHVLEVDSSSTGAFELLGRNAQVLVDAGLSAY